MKKIIFTIAFIATGLVASAQVGVGTTNPETSLEVVGKNADATTKAPAGLDAADGITVPVVTTDMTIALPGIAAGTRVSQMVYSTFAGKQGYYFWDGAKWNAMVPAAAVAPRYENIRGTVPTGLNVAGAYTVKSTDFFIYTTANGAVSITFPVLTVADAGRLVIVYNDNVGSVANSLLGVEGLISNNGGRGRTILWTGTKWVTISV